MEMISFGVSPFLDVNDATLSTTRKNYTLSGVPSGLVVTAVMNFFATIAGGNGRVYISNPNLTDLAPSDSAAPLSTAYESTTAGPFPAQIHMITDASAQISARSNSASTTIKASVLGWTDPRGKW